MYYFGNRNVNGIRPTNFEQYGPFSAEVRWVKENSQKYAIFRKKLKNSTKNVKKIQIFDLATENAYFSRKMLKNSS